MIEFLIEVRANLLFIYLAIFFIGLLGIAFFTESKLKTNGLLGIAFILFMIFTLIGLNLIISTSLRNEIKEEARSALKNDYRILINNKKLNNLNEKQLLTDIGNVNSWYFINHTHPVTTYLVGIIKANDTLEILLQRDSKNSEKYWVYFPKYKYELELDLMNTKELSHIEGSE